MSLWLWNPFFVCLILQVTVFLNRCSLCCYSKCYSGWFQQDSKSSSINLFSEEWVFEVDFEEITSKVTIIPRLFVGLILISSCLEAYKSIYRFSIWCLRLHHHCYHYFPLISKVIFTVFSLIIFVHFATKFHSNSAMNVAKRLTYFHLDIP